MAPACQNFAGTRSHLAIKAGLGLQFVNSLPDDRILDWSKLKKKIAENILKCI